MLSKIGFHENIEDYNSKASAYFKQNACLYCIVYGSQGLTFSQVLNSSHSHFHHFSHEKKVSQTLLICILILSRQQRHGKTTKILRETSTSMTATNTGLPE